jgi:hypothetical protein
VEHDFSEFDEFWQEYAAAMFSQVGADPAAVKGVAAHLWKHAEAMAAYKTLRAVGPSADSATLDAIHKATGMM